MPIAERAKQFMPFAAVKGLNEALAAKEKLREPRRELSEYAAAELNKKLLALSPGQITTVIYYMDEAYVQLTGIVTKLCPNQRRICLHNTEISFDDLFDVISAPKE